MTVARFDDALSPWPTAWTWGPPARREEYKPRLCRASVHDAAGVLTMCVAEHGHTHPCVPSDAEAGAA